MAGSLLSLSLQMFSCTGSLRAMHDPGDFLLLLSLAYFALPGHEVKGGYVFMCSACLLGLGP